MARDLKCSTDTVMPSKKSVAPVNRTANYSSLVLFMKSVFFLHFGCIFFFVKPRAFCSALFFSDLNIKAWNVITMITSLGTRLFAFRKSKSAVRDFVLFMKSVFFTVHFCCIFSL